MDAMLTTGELVMTNFMCQSDWVVGCLDIWSNILLSIIYEGISG